jgi:membrane protein required for colicin V production
MNLLDVILIVVIAFSSVYGLFKGLVKEVISILALIIGLIGASRFYEGASSLLKDLGLGEQAARILSFIILFMVIFIALILIGKLIHKLVHAIFLGWLNRLGGIGFGFIRGIIVSGIIIMILTIILSEKAPILSESKLTPHIMSISKVLVSLVPDDLQKRFMEREEKLREFWERKSKPKTAGICQKSLGNNPKGIMITSSLVGNTPKMAKWHKIENKNPTIGYSHC